MDGQRLQVEALRREELDRPGLDRSFVQPVGSLTPGAELCVGVGDVGEGAAGIEVVLDVIEGPLHSRRPVDVPERVRDEEEGEAGRKGDHLGRDHRVLASAAGHDDARVVEHAPGRGPAEEAQRLGQEHLRPEAVPPGKYHREDHPRIAEHQRPAVHATLLVSDHDVV